MKDVIGQKFANALLYCICSLCVWLLLNLINNQILKPIDELRSEKIQKIDKLEANYYELDKRISVLENNHNKTGETIFDAYGTSPEHQRGRILKGFGGVKIGG